MNHAPVPKPPDPLDKLRPEIYDDLVCKLRSTLPAPVDNTPEALLCRDCRAIAEVAALAPGNATEASLAALAVVSGAHASHCMRQAAEHAHDPKRAGQLQKVSATMGREARAYVVQLLRVQKIRQKIQANPVERARDAATEQRVLRLMTEALESMGPLVTRPVGVAAPPAAVQPAAVKPPEVKPPAAMPPAAMRPVAKPPVVMPRIASPPISTHMCPGAIGNPVHDYIYYDTPWYYLLETKTKH
jgi:hypothetical protein